MKSLWMGAAFAALLGIQAVPTHGAALTFTQISTTFNSPIGIDYHAPTNSVIASVNYPSGSPHNFERINFDGSHSQFSTVSGLTDELKIATARAGSPQFASGTLFSGSGADGVIIKVDPTGGSFLNPWVSLPGPANGLMRGSLYVDRTGVWGGDLIVVTTGGETWRVNGAGVATQVGTDLNVHLEGVMTVPNDPVKYGPLAGKIIAGAEEQGLMHAWDTSGVHTQYSLGVAIEDIDMINANENFFGVNFGTSRILGAAASQFSAFVDDILLTSETGGSGAGLYRLSWNGTALVAEEFTLGVGSASRGQWEHVTFAPAGIREIPPTEGVPEPTTLALAGLGLTAAGLAKRYRR